MSVDFYRKHLMDCYQEMDDRTYGKYAEDYIYQLSVRYRKNKLRRVLRILFPNVWF